MLFTRYNIVWLTPFWRGLGYWPPLPSVLCIPIWAATFHDTRVPRLGVQQFDQGRQCVLGNSLAGWGREPGRFPQILRRCCPSYLWGAVCHVSGTQGYREQTLCPTQTPSQRLGAKQGTYLGNKARQEDGRRDICLGACGPITCIFSHLASGQIVQVLSFWSSPLLAY